jgi:transposase-like protein
MRAPCPNQNCPSFKSNLNVIKHGRFKRRDDGQVMRRFRCKVCLKCFSHATRSLEYKQKKRSVNLILLKLLASGVSMRRSAFILNISRTTVDRKLKFLALKARLSHERFLGTLTTQKVQNLQFDDLITSIHTKLKPVSVSLAVDVNTRKILGFNVAEIPAFGHWAHISRKKYGKRKNEHKLKLIDLFSQIQDVVDEKAIIKSDEHQNYKPLIDFFFPQAHYIQYKSRRGCVVGQGELKKIGNDPLFPINQTFAMLRANINRLFRRTWCLSKCPVRLKDHLDIYVAFHNQIYL